MTSSAHLSMKMYYIETEAKQGLLFTQMNKIWQLYFLLFIKYNSGTYFIKFG